MPAPDFTLGAPGRGAAAVEPPCVALALDALFDDALEPTAEAALDPDDDADLLDAKPAAPPAEDDNPLADFIAGLASRAAAAGAGNAATGASTIDARSGVRCDDERASVVALSLSRKPLEPGA